MKNILFILIVLFACSSPRKSNKKTEGPKPEQDTTELVSLFDTAGGQTILEKNAISKAQKPIGIQEVGGERCDTKTLLYIHQSIDKLTEEAVSKFLDTFSEDCNNAEYTAWSNQLLFDIIDKDVDLYMKVMQSKESDKIHIIMDELSNPLLDYDYQLFYDRIKKSNASKNIKTYHMKALVEAAEKAGVILKK